MFTLNDLTELATSPRIAGIVSTAPMTPLSGPGTPILPSTFIDGKLGITPSAVHRTFDPATGTAALATDADGAPRHSASVVIDSVPAEASRTESALWELRDELSLPGIVVSGASDTVADAAFNKAWAAKTKNATVALPDVDEVRELVHRELASTGDRVSSWTLPHRHVDNNIRQAYDPARGVPVWTPSTAVESLYARITSAGPRNLRDLLRLSPNSVLWGYWLSSGAVAQHKLARSMSSEIVGHGASKHVTGAIKGTPWIASSNVLTDASGGLKIGKEDKKFAKPSTLGLGSVPVGLEKSRLVTCEDILSTAQVSASHLRRVLSTGGLVGEGLDAAVTALTALALLGRTLVLEDTFIRSECDLIPTAKVWTAMTVDAGVETLDVPTTSRELLPVVKDAVTRAQELDVFGTERTHVELDDRMYTIYATSYILRLIGESVDETSEA